MNKDLHDMDDIFNSAYKQFEDDPSPDLWAIASPELIAGPGASPCAALAH